MSIFNIRVRKHKQRRKTKERYGLHASYKGYDHKFERKLERAAGRPNDSAGYSLPENERDLQWDYESKPVAVNAQTRVKSAGKSRVRTEVRTESTEDWA